MASCTDHSEHQDPSPLAIAGLKRRACADRSREGGSSGREEREMAGEDEGSDGNLWHNSSGWRRQRN